MCELSPFFRTENKPRFHEKVCKNKDFRGTVLQTQKDNAANVISFEKKKTLPLTRKELKSHRDSTVCYICRTNSQKSLLKIKDIVMLVFCTETVNQLMQLKEIVRKIAQKMLIFFRQFCPKIFLY